MDRTAVRHDGLLRELSTEECWAHLTAHSLGRIAYVDRDGPLVLPFNYLALDGLIWLRTVSYSSLAIHLPGQQAAFSVDHADERQHTGWSVLVRGRAEHTPGVHPVVPADGPDPTPWPEGRRSMVFCLTPTSVTGRALQQGDVSPAPGCGPGTIQRHGAAGRPAGARP